MKWLVCGGRDFNDYALLSSKLDKLTEVWGMPSTVIVGAAPGADALASRWAYERGVDVEAYGAKWRTHGRGAGPRRNRQMLVQGHPDYVIAFPTPTSKGTIDMIRRAKRAGVPVKGYMKNGRAK